MKDLSLWPASRSKQPPKLETKVGACGTYNLLSVRGRLVLDNASELLEELRRVIRRSDVPLLKVDLKDVAYVDSSGISVLIQGLKLAQEKSVDFVLLDPSPKVKAVMELSQLDNFFTIETSDDDFDDTTDTLILQVGSGDPPAGAA